MAKLLTWIILAYKKLLSPVLGPHCRFYPSCSSYFLQALDTHGALKGSLLGAKRICRCHPLNEGGYDPVPTNNEECQSTHANASVHNHPRINNGY